MAVELDLKSYKSMMSDRVTPGTYTVEITSIDPNDRTREGKPQMLVNLLTLDGEDAGSELVERLPLDPSSKAMFRTVGFLSAMGVPTPRKKIRFDEQRLIGRKLQVEVADNEFGGRTTSQVQSWIRIARTESTEGDLDDLENAAEAALANEEAPTAPSVEAAEEAPAQTPDSADLDLDNLDL